MLSKEGELIKEFCGTFLEYLDFIYDYRTQIIKCEIEHINDYDDIVRLK
ncbi:MAG: hypothetical protein LBV69_04835 [Bacteroidales bacterium]|nr:hypothetical protein [Bacteroidales bacterium]